MESTNPTSSTSSFTSFDALLSALITTGESTGKVDRQSWLIENEIFAVQLQEYFDALDAVSHRTKYFRQPARTANTSFGNYRLLEPIGRGGMGVVYRARHLPLDRIVAVKLIAHGRNFDSPERRRFQNEAELASMLDHPNIVPVYDFGSHDGQFYLAMKLIEGTSLAEWPGRYSDEFKSIGSFRQLQRRAASIVMAVARGVHHAHQRGILHRDLKPSNILLDSSETPYVADFGLAKNLACDSELTQTNLMLGTPSYMAPEQVKPTSVISNIGARSNTSITTVTDVYGLGAILCYLLSGEPPFRGASLHETLAMVCDKEFVPLSKQNAGIDADLDAICQKCLQKSPLDRYATAEELAQDLSLWLNGQPISARPLRAPVRVWRWCRRNKIVASMLALIGILVTFSLLSLSVGYLAARRARDEAINQRRTALANLRAVVVEIADLENRRPDLEDLRLELLQRIQQQLAPMLTDSIHGTLADETNFWLEIDAGDVKKSRGQPSAAKKHFLRAMGIAEKIPKDSNQLGSRLKSFALSQLADIDAHFGERENACEKFQQVLAIRQELSRSNPSNQAQADEALAHLKLASSLVTRGYAEKEENYFNTSAEHARTALEIYNRLVAVEPDNVWHARFKGYAYEDLSQAALALKRWDECLEYCQLGLESLRHAQVRLPQYALIFDWHIAFAYDRQFECCFISGQYALAEQAAQASLQVRENLARFNPQALSVRWQPILSLSQLTVSQIRSGDLSTARQTLERVLLKIDETISILGERQAVLMDLVNAHSRLIDGALPHAEFDEVTLILSNRRTELLRKLMSDKETADNTNLMFWTLMERAQLHLLRSEWDLAEQSLVEASQHLSSSSMLSEPDTAKISLQAHQALLSQARSSTSAEAFHVAELLELVRSPCVLVRLRLDLADRKDAEGLKRLSQSLWDCSEEFYRKQTALECLLTAIEITQSSARKQELRTQAAERIAQLREFPSSATEMLSKAEQLLEGYR